MKIQSVILSAFTLMIVFVLSCTMAAPDSSADPIVQTDGGLTYTLTEGGGDKYYAEVTAYDGTTSDVVIKSVITSGGIDYQVVSVKENIFKDTSIRSVVIQSNENLSLTAGMFSGCSSLDSVNVGEGIKEIPSLFCHRCISLSTVVLPSSLEIIGESAFAYCSHLSSVSLGGKVTTLMTAAFEGCAALPAIVIPDSVTVMGPRVFNQCTSLAEVTLGTGLTIVPANAFSSSVFKSINIPAKVTSIDKFSMPATLESFTVDNDNLDYESKDGVLYSKKDGSLHIWPKSKGGEITLYDVPSSVLQESLATKVTVSEGVTVIGNSAFKNCKSLKEVLLPSTLTTIELSAFTGCSALETISIPASVTELPSYCFDGCSALTTVDLNHVTKLGDTVFADCISLTNIDLSGIQEMGVATLSGCAGLTTVVWPKTITDIPGYAFNDCVKLVSVDFVKVTSVGVSAFQGCTQFTTLDLSSAREIGISAFKGCSALSNVKLCDDLSVLETSVFEGCSSLVIDHLPKNLTTIRQKALIGTATTTMIIGEFDTQVNLIDGKNPDGNQNLGGSALKKIILDNALAVKGAAAAQTITAKKIINFKSTPNLETIVITERFDGQAFITETYGLENQLPIYYADKIYLKSISPFGTITYDLLAKNSVKELDPATAPDGFTFIGWFTDEALTIPYDSSSPISENTVVYAKFRVDAFTVNFVIDGKIVDTIAELSKGEVISLKSVSSDGKIFSGWMVNDLLLGAQYSVSALDSDNLGVITLTAAFSDPVLAVSEWALTVSGDGIDGKVFWTKSNSIGSYGMITVVPGQFERPSFEVSENGGYGILSDTCVMVYSNDGKDVSVTVTFSDVGKASDYTVSLVEIVKDNAPGFRATVSADGGYVDTDGTFSICYVYKVYDEENQVWAFTTSGQTTGVEDAVIALGTEKASKITGDFVLDIDGAYLVYGYASYSFKDESAGATVTEVVTSPVIMSVSEIQAVTKP